jgi:hypothetical protein
VCIQVKTPVEVPDPTRQTLNLGPGIGERGLNGGYGGGGGGADEKSAPTPTNARGFEDAGSSFGGPAYSSFGGAASSAMESTSTTSINTARVFVLVTDSFFGEETFHADDSLSSLYAAAAANNNNRNSSTSNSSSNAVPQPLPPPPPPSTLAQGSTVVVFSKVAMDILAAQFARIEVLRQHADAERDKDSTVAQEALAHRLELLQRAIR